MDTSPDGNILSQEVPVSPQASEDTPSLLTSVTGNTPWWVVSILLHALVITLAGLLSVTFTMPNNESPLTLTEICPSISEPAAPRLVKTDSKAMEDIMAPPRTKDTNKQVEDKSPPQIYVIPDGLDIGDHEETVNFSLPDDHGAWGGPDSQVFRKEFSDSPAGGGPGDSLLQDIIGSGAGTSGFTTGKGYGFGPAAGDGFGTYSSRCAAGRKWICRRYCVPTGCSARADLSLQWLAEHQEYDGHWDATKYGARTKVDTAVTALALLTFLGNGTTEKVGHYQDNVRRAVAWLKSKQAADGLVWDTTDDGAAHRARGYPGAMAALALAEAAGMAHIPDTMAAAQKAIDYLTEAHQSGEGSDRYGWRYAPKDGNPDISVSGWCIMALKSAKVSGLHVDPAAFQGAIKFLDSVEHKNAAGDSGYEASQYWYTKSDAHNDSSHRLTAIGTLARQFLGWKREELESTVTALINKGGVPTWGNNGESIDLYYYYYASLCAFQQQGESWKRWSTPMVTTLTEHQQKDGSWDPVGAYSEEWGRVGQTSLSTLCLEVVWRYREHGPIK